MYVHDLFLRFHSLFGDIHILEIQAPFHSFKQFCMHILYNGATYKWKYLYHITDIGNVNNIIMIYWEYPYIVNGFDTLRNKNMQSIFQYIRSFYPAAF